MFGFFKKIINRGDSNQDLKNQLQCFKKENEKLRKNLEEKTTELQTLEKNNKTQKKETQIRKRYVEQKENLLESTQKTLCTILQACEIPFEKMSGTLSMLVYIKHLIENTSNEAQNIPFHPLVYSLMQNLGKNVESSNIFHDLQEIFRSCAIKDREPGSYQLKKDQQELLHKIDQWISILKDVIRTTYGYNLDINNTHVTGNTVNIQYYTLNHREKLENEKTANAMQAQIALFPKKVIEKLKSVSGEKRVATITEIYEYETDKNMKACLKNRKTRYQIKSGDKCQTIEIDE